MGSEIKASKYWKEESEKMCRMCGEQEEDIVHILEKCRETGRKAENWIVQIQSGRRTLARLKKILWMRKEKGKEIEIVAGYEER